MKTIIFHIGHFKTGSTSLQHVLASNADGLKQQGVLYPKTGLLLGGHHDLAYVLHNRQRYSLPEAPDAYLSALTAEVAKATESRIVLSTEHFALYDPEAMLALFPDCRKQVILYVRRQDYLLDSLYRELVKSSHYEGTIEAFCRDVLEQVSLPTFNGPVVADYGAILDGWARHADVESITVRPYESGLPAGGVVSDFLDLLGLTDRSGFETDVDLNRKHPAELVILRRTVDPLLPPELRLNLRGLLWQVTQTVRFPNQDLMLNGTQRAALVHTYAASNAAVARRYLGRADGRLFEEEDPLPFTGAVRQDRLTVDDVAGIFTALVTLQNQHLVRQEELIQQLQQQVAALESRQARPAPVR